MTFRTTYSISDKDSKATPRDISSKPLAWGVVATTLFSLWIRSGVLLVAAPIAYHDDAFFARTANYILSGQWLGPYDKMTLAKGMFYPLFVAVASELSVPLKIAEQALYLAAAGLASLVISRASGRRWVGLLAYIGLALNPVFWHPWLAHVSREGVYTALSISLFALITWISFPALRRSRGSIALGVGFGVVWAAFWLTREESIWLLPACAIPIVIGTVSGVIVWRKNSGRPPGVRAVFEQLRPLLMPMIIGMAVFLCGVGLVAGVNWKYYGVFRTNEFRSGGFVRAYGAFARIEGGPFRRYVLVPKEARVRAYEVSSAARQLASSLEDGQGRAWREYGCAFHPIPGPCDQQAWIIWALRDAAEQAGHYRSASETDAFFSTIADDINSACKAGTIQCTARRDTFTPPFRWEYIGETLESSRGLFKLVFDFGNGEVGATPSRGSATGFTNFADLTNETVAPSGEPIAQDLPLGQVTGWVADRVSTPSLEVTSYTKRAVKSSITTAAASDVAAVHPDLKAVRFTLQSDCPAMECGLTIHSNGGNVVVPFQKLLRGAPINTPNLILFVDTATTDEQTWPVGERRRAIQMRIARKIGRVYAKSSSFLAGLASLGLLAAMIRWRKRPFSVPLLAVALGCGTAVASRIFLLGYIAATSFDTYFLHYCSPATPFLIIYIGLGIYLGCTSLVSLESANPQNAKAHEFANSSSVSA